MRCADLIEIFDGRRCDNDGRHESELCQRDSFACTTLPQSLLRPLERTRDRIEERCDTRRIRIDLIERSRQQRACKRARIDVGSRRERAQLRRVLLIELDVEPRGPFAHNSAIHRFTQSVLSCVGYTSGSASNKVTTAPRSRSFRTIRQVPRDRKPHPADTWFHSRQRKSARSGGWLLGGDITVESDVDRGSTFTLWLPHTSVEPDQLGRAHV